MKNMNLPPVLKNLFALGFGLTLLFGVDIGLGWIGVTPLSMEDPFVGFAGSRPLFIEQEQGRFVLDEARKNYFNTPQEFVMPKPANTFRIVVFGGSTTYGRPYLNDTSFGHWLKKLLERYGDVGRVEVINTGGISYASYRVRRLVEEMAAYQPDLFVVYSGHNEFLEARTFEQIKGQAPLLSQVRSLLHHSRIYSALTRTLGHALPDGVQKTELGEDVGATLEQIGGPELYHRDAEFRAGVIRQYHHEIKSIAAFSRERRIPLILCTLPSNLAHMSPFKSELRNDFSDVDYRNWSAAFEAGEEALRNNDITAAERSYATASTLDPGYALGQYRLGQVFRETGRTIKAYQMFLNAKEEDVVPLRALSVFNESLRQIALEEQAALADVEATFRRVSPDGLPGDNLFVDHVHPGIEGQQLIAWVILNAATKVNVVPLDKSSWQEQHLDARAYLLAEYERIPARYLAMGYWGVGRLFLWAGKYPEAYAALQRAWETVRDVPEIPRQLAELELLHGNAEAALTFVAVSEQLDPENPDLALIRAAALSLAGRAGEAILLLEEIGRPSGEAALHFDYAFGQALHALGRFDEALASFRSAVAGAPRLATFHLAEAETLKALGQRQPSALAYRRYLELTDHPLPEQALAAWAGEK